MLTPCTIKSLRPLVDNLIVSAKSADGVVEGFETSDGSLLAVQWHPELLDAPDPTFKWIVAAAKKHHDA